MPRSVTFAMLFLLSGCGLLNDRQAKREAERSIASQLKDPSSATFRNVRYLPNSGAKLVCGEVSGKNGYGAYDGYSRFMYSMNLHNGFVEEKPNGDAGQTELVDQLKFNALWADCL